jgi:hypothetical protein
MWESIVVGFAVAAAACFVVRSLYKSATGKSKSCGCGLTTCPMNESGECDPSKGAPSSENGRHGVRPERSPGDALTYEERPLETESPRDRPDPARRP